MAETLTGTASDAAERFPEFVPPRAGACPFAPPPALAEIREEKPISKVRIWDGSTPWLITRHEDLRAVLGDPRVSVDDKRPGFPFPKKAMAENAHHHPDTLFNTDAPVHTRLRRMLTSSFTAKRMAALRPAIQKVTDEHIDAMLAGPKPADLVQVLGLPIPTLMICELLGVPYEDHEFFQYHATVAVSQTSSAEQDRESSVALGEYLARQIQVKTENPAEDALSDLAALVKAGELTMGEASLMAVILLIAGHETSANMIALGTLALLEHPEQLALLRETDDPKVVAGAVEELLRYLTIAHTGQRRIALEDIEIGGEVIRAGDGIIVSLPAANWDPEAFPEPDRLDLLRDARQHNAFAFGVHQCLGQQLARVELQVVYGTLYRRVPTLRLATALEEIDFKEDAMAYGVAALPVTW
ncbi:cytochrome P450 [Streptomyces sp. NPDC059697]|uniref:cytochrome P450 n=1 Tax=Streptomyces sp. NPDC059697 TaxID=3346912 RepID=UPI0036B020CF